jgi:hypothetical protein
MVAAVGPEASEVEQQDHGREQHDLADLRLGRAKWVSVG